jgi:GTP pyrophosphokinase
VSAEQISELRAGLLAALEERAPKVDRDRVGRVFRLRRAAHGDQQRDVRGAVRSLPWRRVLILLDLLERASTPRSRARRCSTTSSRTRTSTSTTWRSVRREVAGSVEGVTKLSGLHFDSRESEQAENFRKMLLSMSRDLRVIFIKLADRLHNMRTLEHLRPDKIERIARETRDIYAPLAHRLGIASIKRELEDLSLKALDSASYSQIAQRVQVKRKEREAFLADVKERLIDGLRAAGVKAEVSGRPKHFFSIYAKLQDGRSFENIYDLFGLRIITHTRNDCYRALGVVHDQFTPVGERFKDYIATPKSNMYQSLHTTVLTAEGEMVEVQIRTREMHRTAETGVAAHYVYKQGGVVDAELDARLGGFVAQTQDWQEGTTGDEYMDFLRTALYQEEVFVYTPRRELKRLPKGATALDFAFLIHTEVGQHTIGVRVNGELVPLRHVLKSGDTVEIMTSPQAQPHEDWLHFLRTAGARTKVRHWLRQQRHSDSVSLGKEMVERELKRLRVKPEERALAEVALGLGCTDLEQMYARLAEGTLSLGQIVRKFTPEKETLAERLAKGPLEALGIGRKPEVGIRIQGIENVMLHFARCCQPVPGDRVIGVVTQGRGVSVHRLDCPNTFDDRVPPERKVTVEWDAGRGETFPVRLVVYGQDRTSLLADIAKAIAATAVNIRTAGIASEDQTARGVFVVEVPHLTKLNEVVHAIRRVKGVARVERRQRMLRRPPTRRASGEP